MKIRYIRYTYPWYLFIGSVLKLQVKTKDGWVEPDIEDVSKEDFFK